MTRQGGSAAPGRPAGKEEAGVRSAPRPARGEAAPRSRGGAGPPAPEEGCMMEFEHYKKFYILD